MITQEYLKSLFNYNPETGLFTQTLIRAQRKKIGTIDSKGYLRIGIDGKYYRAHRLAFLYMTGKFPENQVIIKIL